MARVGPRPPGDSTDANAAEVLRHGLSAKTRDDGQRQQRIENQFGQGFHNNFCWRCSGCLMDFHSLVLTQAFSVGWHQ